MKRIKNRLFIFAVIIVSICQFQSCNNKSKKEYKKIDYVDPFIGVSGGGNVFPGASMPFGMVKLGPDYHKRNTNSGYSTETDKIDGFSHVHVSGTGGGPKYGNINILPYFNTVNDTEDYYLYRFNEYSEVGYYRVSLSQTNNIKERNRQNAIQVELTSSERAGLHHYYFPKSEESKVIIDLRKFLTRGIEYQRKYGEEQQFVDASFKIESDSIIMGFSTVRGGWNKGTPYSVYFYGVFNHPFKVDKFFGDSDQKQGSILNFNTNRVQDIFLKIGISFKSTKRAKDNLYSKVYGVTDWNIEAVKDRAQKKWEEILSKVSIETDDLMLKKSFYTGIYHSYLMPVNRTGEFVFIKSDDSTYYDDFYAIWDTYRTVDPLRLLLTPEMHRKILLSLYNIYIEEGFFPDARSGNSSGMVQGGTNVDILFSEAIQKGINIEKYDSILDALIKNAEKEVEVNKIRKVGRGANVPYIKYKYIPYIRGLDSLQALSFERAGSRTLEYSYCDWGIYNLMKCLGRSEKATTYKERANYWKNLWCNYDTLGISGFIMPKDTNGNCIITDHSIFRFEKTSTWEEFFYEGTSWIYSLFAPHDINSLIELSGGEEKFVARLDFLFKQNKFDITNEPSFLVPVMYNWTSKAWKTAERVDEIKKTYFSSSRNGLPGNDDSGAMSAWYVFHTLGLYPLAGSDIYLISTPSVNSAKIKVKDGSFNLVVRNLTKENIYIKNIFLNNKPIKRLWITHNELSTENELKIIMGSNKNEFYKDELEVPYSLSRL